MPIAAAGSLEAAHGAMKRRALPRPGRRGLRRPGGRVLVRGPRGERASRGMIPSRWRSTATRSSGAWAVTAQVDEFSSVFEMPPGRAPELPDPRPHARAGRPASPPPSRTTGCRQSLRRVYLRTSGTAGSWSYEQSVLGAGRPTPGSIPGLRRGARGPGGPGPRSPGSLGAREAPSRGAAPGAVVRQRARADILPDSRSAGVNPRRRSCVCPSWRSSEGRPGTLPGPEPIPSELTATEARP